MSSGKFASITAGLLSRKGEGQPWTQGTAQEPPRVPLSWRNEGPIDMRNEVREPPSPIRSEVRSEVRSEPRRGPAAPPPPPSATGPVKDKSCAVRMSLHDFERLGIVAVKDGVSRQKLLKDALARYLAGKAKDYGCACLGNSLGNSSGACEGNCGQAG